VILAVDASALVAIALDEPERPTFLDCLRQASASFVTPTNYLEAGLVIVLRHSIYGLPEYAAWLDRLRVEQKPVDGAGALQAYLQYGKGVHRAGLNLADCFAYALAKQLDAPLLYKGNDFALTDVRRALQPT